MGTDDHFTRGNFKMIKRNLILLVLTCLILGASAFGQRKPISADEFNSILSNARKTADVFPVRVRLTEEFYSDGQVARTREHVWETVSPDRKRKVFTEKSGNRTQTLEEIEIGLYLYQKENDGPWTKKKWYFLHGLDLSLIHI
jgi:hypothetical protein